MSSPIIQCGTQGAMTVIRLPHGSWLFSYATLVGVTIEPPTGGKLRYRANVKHSTTTQRQLTEAGYSEPDVNRVPPDQLLGAAVLAI